MRLEDRELRLIPQEVRVKLLEYLLEKGLRPGDLGVSSAYLRMIRKGERKVSDSLLRKVLAFLTVEEYAYNVQSK